VELSNEIDFLGRRRVSLDWRLTALDIQSIITSQEIVDAELRRIGAGGLKIDYDTRRVKQKIQGGWHHMGTTRMHADPRRGVVDPNSKVHDTANLYIAGPSVFPTSGYANPVLTIVALAIRLADHLKGVLRSSSE
jgi:choline dehydrogenase-like flavoprotein